MPASYGAGLAGFGAGAAVVAVVAVVGAGRMTNGVSPGFTRPYV
jgi:hypothetical protein